MPASHRCSQRIRMSWGWYYSAQTLQITSWPMMASTRTSPFTASWWFQTLSFWRRYSIRSILKVNKPIVSFHIQLFISVLQLFWHLIHFTCTDSIRVMFLCIPMLLLYLSNTTFVKLWDTFVRIGSITAAHQGWTRLSSPWISFKRNYRKTIIY